MLGEVIDMTTLTPKENSLLKDLRSQEELCVEKYTKHAQAACDPQLKDLFNTFTRQEQTHIQTLDAISAGSVPAVNGQQGQTAQPTFSASSCPAEAKKNDEYLCADALASEKHVSSAYDTCIFEFTDPGVRAALNHIQKEEQQHGEQIWRYMSANNWYC